MNNISGNRELNSKRVQCYYTGEQGDADSYYKVGLRWFKSKQTYDNWRKANTQREQCLKIIADIIGIPDIYLPEGISNWIDQYKPGYGIVRMALEAKAYKIKRHLQSSHIWSNIGAFQYISIEIDKTIKSMPKTRTCNTEQASANETLLCMNSKKHDISRFLKE